MQCRARRRLSVDPDFGGDLGASSFAVLYVPTVVRDFDRPERKYLFNPSGYPFIDSPFIDFKLMTLRPLVSRLLLFIYYHGRQP